VVGITSSNIPLSRADPTSSRLVVVGAAHLVGKDGIIQILREKGYSVEQM
jgi:uncharacterized protein YbaP (TraB family)